MKLERDHDREGLLSDFREHWRASGPMATIRIYQRGEGWAWKIITARSVPFVSREDFPTKNDAWQAAVARLAKMAAELVAALEVAAEEAATT